MYMYMTFQVYKSAYYGLVFVSQIAHTCKCMCVHVKYNCIHVLVLHCIVIMNIIKLIMTLYSVA